MLDPLKTMMQFDSLDKRYANCIASHNRLLAAVKDAIENLENIEGAGADRIGASIGALKDAISKA